MAKGTNSGYFVVGVLIVLAIIYLVLSPSSPVTHPLVVVSGHAGTSLFTQPVLLTFKGSAGSYVASVQSNGAYSVSLPNDNDYSVVINWTSTVKNTSGTCTAGTLALYTASSNFTYDASC